MLPRRLPLSRRATRPAQGGAAAALVALALAGCGGRPATRTSVIARGNGICTNAARALADLPPGGGSAGSPIDFGRAAPIVSREAKALNALPRPAAERSLLNRFLAAETALAAEYRRVAAAQRAGDRAAVAHGLEVLGRSEAGALGRRYGLSQCGAVTATVH